MLLPYVCSTCVLEPWLYTLFALFDTVYCLILLYVVGSRLLVCLFVSMIPEICGAMAFVSEGRNPDCSML